MYISVIMEKKLVETIKRLRKKVIFLPMSFCRNNETEI